MKFDTISRQLLLTTARIACTTPSTTSTGTGFFYNTSTSDKEFLPLLVTAKHVVRDASSIKTWVLKSNKDGEPILGEAVEIDLPPWQAWYIHPNPDVDIAFLPVLSYMPSLTKNPGLAVRALDRTLLITPDQLDDFDAVEDIVFVGYPNGLYDTVNYLPLIRRGSTASPIHLEWSGKPQFLVDASVFPGSSGSPVFALSQGSFRTREAVNIGTRIALLGLMSAAHVRFEENGELLLSTMPRVRTQHMLDLGVVQHWAALEEAISSADLLKSALPEQSTARPARSILA